MLTLLAQLSLACTSKALTFKQTFLLLYLIIIPSEMLVSRAGCEFGGKEIRGWRRERGGLEEQADA